MPPVPRQTRGQIGFRLRKGTFAPPEMARYTVRKEGASEMALEEGEVFAASWRGGGGLDEVPVAWMENTIGWPGVDAGSSPLLAKQVTFDLSVSENSV